MKKKLICMILTMALVLSTLLSDMGYVDAAKNPVLSSKTVTIIRGKTKKVTVKKVKKATFKWSVASKKIAKISKGVKKQSVTVKGLKTGKTILKCKVKIKGKKTISLKAKIIVKNKAATTPTTTPNVTPGVTKVPVVTAAPTAAPTVAPTNGPAVTPTPGPVDKPDDYTMTKDIDIDKDSTGSTSLKDNGDGTSTVVFSGNYTSVMIPVGTEEAYDLSSYTKLIVDAKIDEEIRVSLFDAKGVNLMPPTSGTAEWSQWTYIKGDQKFDVDITSIPREKVAYVVLCSGEKLSPVTLRGIQFYADDYRLSFSAQYTKDTEGSTKVVDNKDCTSKVNFASQYANISIPLGEENSYNLS